MKTTTTPSPATQPKRFASVRDLVKATAANDDQIREFDRRIRGSAIVNALVRSRAAAGMTQADVAERMERTQSAVSKLEHSTDAELSLQDIASYLHATGGRLNLGIGKQPNRVERIKELAICLEGELKSLADLSSNSDDRAIRQSINGFFGEAWFNFFKILCDATSRLPMEPEETSPVKLLGTETGFMNVTPKAEMANC
jgi:transcriptional regulator with XRE-family HTH domain